MLDTVIQAIRQGEYPGDIASSLSITDNWETEMCDEWSYLPVDSVPSAATFESYTLDIGKLNLITDQAFMFVHCGIGANPGSAIHMKAGAMGVQVKPEYNPDPIVY
jgi:hypothetical protein